MQNVDVATVGDVLAEPSGADLSLWILAAAIFVLIVILLLGGDDQPPYW